MPDSREQNDAEKNPASESSVDPANGKDTTSPKEGGSEPSLNIFGTAMLHPTSSYGTFLMITMLALSFGLVLNGLLYVNGTYELVPDYEYDFQFNGIDHYDKTRGFYSEITMESKAFAAHNPIHVTAKVVVYRNQSLPDGTVVGESIDPKELPEVYVVFPRSHIIDEPRVEFPDPRPGGAIVAVYGEDGKPYWSGEVDLKYEMQGSYILGITSRPVDIIEEQDLVRTASFINIASEEVTSRMFTDRLLVGLTWGIMGIALLTAIPVFNAVFVFAEKHDQKRGEKKKGDKP